MTSEQAFELLGIQNRDIDEASLKKAFYSAARRTHPDSNPGDEDADEKFRLINEAYAVLCEYIKHEEQIKRASAGSGRVYGRKQYRTKRGASSSGQRAGASSAAGGQQTEASGASSATGRQRTDASGNSSAAGRQRTEASGAASASGRQRTEASGAASAAGGQRTDASGAASASGRSETDTWRAYRDADLRYAKQRHEDATERAAETIRNHWKLENEQAAQAARQREAREEMRREQEAWEKNAWESARRTSGQGEGGRLRQFWNVHIAANRRLQVVVFLLLVVILIVWAGTVLLGMSGQIAGTAYTLAVIAKWILIVWMTGEVTWIVHKNWNNRILSAFAFLVSMELVIILMNWLEDVVRSLANRMLF